MEGIAGGLTTVPLGKGKKKSHNNNNNASRPMQLGLIFSFVILSVYFYGFLESMFALPEIPLVHRRLGKNLNLARQEEEQSSTTTSVHKLGTRKTSKKKTTANFQNTNTENENNNSKREANGDDVVIPPHIFPASVRNEDGAFVTILHPGDGKTNMSVPPFWSPPLHHMGLMSRQTALGVGSCLTPDPKTGSLARGDDCPKDDRTIYLAIASYRDFQCRFTLESAFLRAKNPRRIRVGVVDQIVNGEDPACDEPIEPCETNPQQALCLYKDRVDVYEMEAGLSVGPVFARHIGHRMYRGEYYYTQSDAHVSYTLHWDADIIEQMEATQNEMAVLSTYLTDVQGSIDPQGHSTRNTRPIMCNTDYEGRGESQHLRHGSQPERVPHIHGVPQMQPYWAAGYSFSRGHFVVNVPYDLYQPMIFQGEEMSIGIRGFTIGYDFYAPERSVCFHHYAIGNNAKKRNRVPHFWEHAREYKGVGVKAMRRLLGIVHMNPEIDPSTWNHDEEVLYGVGGVRTPELFYKTFGIDVFNKRTEHHLCQFVDKGQMHNQFQPLLRPDGMGIDYNRITYQFKDPHPTVKEY